MKLVALKARSVRGIPRDWPDLPIDDKGLIIYGPNGVGKSSIIDAIEFALTQKSTLFSENRAGVSWETASPHVHHGQPQIALMVRDGSTTLDITPENIPAGISAHAKNWLETAQKAIDLQKMNWKFRTGFPEYTGVSLTAHVPNNSRGGYTRVHQDTAQSRHRQRSAQSSAARLSAR